MRLGLISIVNLHVTPAHPGEIVVFFNEKCALYKTPQIPCVFSGKLRLAFTVTVNSYDPRPTGPGLRIFFQLKRPWRKPFQIPCVFTSKTRLAFNLTVNLNGLQPTATTVLALKIRLGYFNVLGCRQKLTNSQFQLNL